MHTMRAEERGTAGAEERAPIAVGDHVAMTGRVTIVSENGAGVRWVMVALDGEPDHAVACWAGNLAPRTTSPTNVGQEKP